MSARKPSSVASSTVSAESVDAVAESRPVEATRSSHPALLVLARLLAREAAAESVAGEMGNTAIHKEPAP